MWPFRNRPTSYELGLIERLPELTRRVETLEADLDVTKAALERLRGRYYATRGPPEPAPAAPAAESKAEILARMGYVRGVPPKRG